VRGYLKRLLVHAPKELTDWAKMAYGMIPDWVRYGKHYRSFMAILKESESWDYDALVMYQEDLLTRMVTHCYDRVPYYRLLFDQAGLTPSHFSTISDLGKLPLLTKSDVRKNKQNLRAQDFPRFQIESEETSGSTGEPLDFSIDMATRAMERALALRQLMWLGYKPGDVVAEIKEESFADPLRLYTYSPVSKMLRLGTFRAAHERLEAMVRVLQRFRPRFLRGYPSSLSIVARWMERHKISVPSVEYVITSSETLYPSIKSRIEQIFKCPTIDHYGQNEQVAYAFQCSEAGGYHIQMEQNLVELIPAADGQWEIVGTSLWNRTMPFLRYRTGDFAVKVQGTCPCGRKHPMLASIKGKHGDIIVTPERNLVSVVTMTEALIHFEEIKESQIVQEEVKTLIVKVVPWEKLTQANKEALLGKLRYYLGSEQMNILIEEVPEIPRIGRGKKPFVISHVSIDDYL
jgi:phenylacetate-CoA ligase